MSAFTARPTPQTSAGNQLDGLRIIRRHARKTGLDASHAEFIKCLRNLQFLPGRQNHADALLAVAQRSVVKLHCSARGKTLSHLGTPVQLADPESVLHLRRSFRHLLTQALAAFPPCNSW